MHRLLQGSVWSKDAIPPDEWKYRSLTRVVLPLLDILVILAGVSGARLGIPAIQEFFPASVTVGASLLLSVAGFVSLAGVLFPRLWLVEVIGKAAMIGLLSAYVIALLMLTAEGDPTRGFVSVLATVALLLPGWRLYILGLERRTRVDEGL